MSAMRRFNLALAVVLACEACTVELLADDDGPCVDENDCPQGACVYGECTSYVPRQCTCSATVGCNDDEVCDTATETCTIYCDDDTDCAWAHPLACDVHRGLCVEPCIDSTTCTDDAAACVDGRCSFGGK